MQPLVNFSKILYVRDFWFICASIAILMGLFCFFFFFFFFFLSFHKLSAWKTQLFSGLPRPLQANWITAFWFWQGYWLQGLVKTVISITELRMFCYYAAVPLGRGIEKVNSTFRWPSISIKSAETRNVHTLFLQQSFAFRDNTQLICNCLKHVHVWAPTHTVTVWSW